jgi:hypothetical protein
VEFVSDLLFLAQLIDTHAHGSTGLFWQAGEISRDGLSDAIT